MEKPQVIETVVPLPSSCQKARREEGLRVLARMIATAYMRRLGDTERANVQYARSLNAEPCGESNTVPLKSSTGGMRPAEIVERQKL